MMLAMMSLTVGDYAALAGLLTAIVGVPMAIFAGTVRSLAKRVDTVESRAHGRIDTIETQLRDVTNEKVDKRDWLREVMSSRAKVDRISEQIAAMDGKLTTEFGVGAAMKGLAAQLGRMAENKGNG